MLHLTLLSSLVLVLAACHSPVSASQRASDASATGLPALIDEYQADRGALRRFYAVPGSANRLERLERWLGDWQARLAGMDFAALSREEQVDVLLLQGKIEAERAAVQLERERNLQMAPLLPYAEAIVALAEGRARVEPIDSEWAGAELDRLRKLTQECLDRPTPAELPERAVALRAARRSGELLSSLREWHKFRAGYDPTFDWWTAKPMAELEALLGRHATHLREEMAGLKPDDEETIVGDPIGRTALERDLALAWIPYSPEELIQIGEREFAWCEERMLAAAGELGFGDDWKPALEHVKNRFVPPGEQPRLVLELAREAWDFVETQGLVTVPALAKEVWRMNMLSPEAQRESPFFLGGESIYVAYPTDSMSHEDKRMSMRGNNRHFARATVHHEVIPGHHLQDFMENRYFSYRQPFSTPFWTEGWALWWEMLLWDRGFFATPEDRIGALFWRMHRCARIQFSLRFHLGEWSSEQCIQFLIDKVGHESENAEAEVRRSFQGDYGPLYQLAYMIGALQFRALHSELVSSGRMGVREFHDAVLRGGNMPVAMVRARISAEPLQREGLAPWRFDPVAGR